MLSTATRQPYLEIQGGPIADQSIKLELQPDETRSHAEYWIPTDTPLEIHSLTVPAPALRPVTAIPLFGWARADEVQVWNALIETYQSKGMPPDPPRDDESRWAPSGMDGLQPAFEWAVARASGEDRDRWRCHYGAWLGGRGEIEHAIEVLTLSDSGLAKALLARLLASKDDVNGAAKAYASIRERWLQLHPQVVVERDKALRRLGKQTLAERERWLHAVDALPDEWIVERRVQLLIDKGQFRTARRLLLATRFQRVHQTYSRTGLWMQICKALNEPCRPIPPSLGEDRLARFGAYREYE